MPKQEIVFLLFLQPACTLTLPNLWSNLSEAWKNFWSKNCYMYIWAIFLYWNSLNNHQTSLTHCNVSTQSSSLTMILHSFSDFFAIRDKRDTTYHTYPSAVDTLLYFQEIHDLSCNYIALNVWGRENNISWICCQ